MSEKKISFGFSKSIKPKILTGTSTPKNDNSIELIKCLEGQTIKIIGEVKKEEKPLIIPLKSNTKTSAALAALQALKDTIEGNETPTNDNVVTQNSEQNIDNNQDPQTLEQRAAQEILQSLVEHQELDGETNNILSLPLTSDQIPLDGANESTLNDYEDIPISQFGLAMLRGMGFKDEVKSDKKVGNDEPMVRPKGMGLGADKMVKPKTLLVAPAKDEVLEFKKGACVRVLLGKHKDLYGQIESLDDHAGRLLIKLALGGTKEWFNEFMVQPVSKAEYVQYGKVINSAKYEEYKKKQEEKERLDNLKIEKGESSESANKANRRYDQRNDSSSADDEKHVSRVESESRSQQSQQIHQKNSDKHSRNRERRYSDDKERKSDQISQSRSYKRDSSEESPHRRSKKSSHNKSSDDSVSDNRRKYSSKSSHKKTKSKRHFKSRSYSRDHRQRCNSSEDDDKHYQKKTKKSKRPRSRSRDRR